MINADQENLPLIHSDDTDRKDKTTHRRGREGRRERRTFCRRSGERSGDRALSGDPVIEKAKSYPDQHGLNGSEMIAKIENQTLETQRN
jgi:hypothetical protein